MSFSVPATDITPQPITKLPNIKDQRTLARRLAEAATGALSAAGAAAPAPRVI
jgi:hypothetical protein